MYEELIQRLRNDAKNQEQVLHICDSTRNALEAAFALEDLDAQLDILVKADSDAQEYKSLGTIDHLRGLVEAERNGRLAVLPCKVGDKVYVPDRNSRKVIKKEVRQVSFNHHGKWLVFVGCLVIDVEEFGKTVFLTREEAEAEMGGGADGAK